MDGRGIVGRMRLALLTGVLLATSASQAAPRETPVVVASQRAQLRTAVTPILPASVRPAARALFAALASRGWQASWDRERGSVHRLWGSFIEVPGAMRDAAIAERAAREFLQAHRAVLAPGAGDRDFALVANRVDDHLRTVGFHQMWRGMRVVGGQVSFVFARDRLFVVGSEAFPEVATPSSPGEVTDLARRATAEAWLAADTGLVVRTRPTTSRPERVVLPIRTAAARFDYHVADVVEVEAVGAPGRWDVFVGLDGTPLARASKLHTAEGTLVFNVGTRSPGGARADYPASRATATVDAVATTTDAVGGFAWTGVADAIVLPSVVGTFLQVITHTGAAATATLTAQPGQPVVWNRAADELDDAQLTSYVFVAIAKAAARIIDPGPAMATWLDTQLQVHVNEAQSCNAYSTGDDIHFFVKSAQCENTGRLADVILHEFGHSFHNHAVIVGTGAFEVELSEGVSDFLAAHIVDDHALGRGFFLDDLPLRDIDPVGYEFRYPDDVSVDPHVSGLIIAGALWDLRRAAIAELGRPAGLAFTETIFRGVLQRASDLASSYVAALTIDDDNADLGDGTPHGCLIGRAFAAHGLAPAFVTTTIGTPTTAGLEITVPVSIPTAATCAPPQVSSATIAWERAGESGTVAMTAQGASYVGTLPAQPANALVHYTVSVALDDGSRHQLPRNLADPKYQLFTGSPQVIWCDTLDANPIPTWTVMNTQGNLWEWGVPDATSFDPVAAHTGTRVLGTLLHGSGRYPDDDSSRIVTPAIPDTARYAQVRLQYRRWLTVEDALYDQATIEANGATVWANTTDQRGTLNHLDREWRFHDIDLTAQAAAGSLTLAFTLATDASGEYGGWTLDDVCVVGIPHPGCGDGATTADEMCDDGNVTDGDGCSASCTEEAVPSEVDAGCCGVATDPTGPVLLALGLFGLRRRRPQ